MIKPSSCMWHTLNSILSCYIQTPPQRSVRWCRKHNFRGRNHNSVMFIDEMAPAGSSHNRFPINVSRSETCVFTLEQTRPYVTEKQRHCTNSISHESFTVNGGFPLFLWKNLANFSTTGTPTFEEIQLIVMFLKKDFDVYLIYLSTETLWKEWKKLREIEIKLWKSEKKVGSSPSLPGVARSLVK